MTINQKIIDHFDRSLDGLLDSHEYQDFIRSFSEPPVTGLRVNTLKISVSDFKKITPFTLQEVPWSDTGFYIEDDAGQKPGKHPHYYAGLYYLQEPSAMLPAELLALSADPAHRVLDLCAAPGGKSTQMAAIMNNQGCLVVNDNSPKRIRALLSNLIRMGVTNAVVYNRMPETLLKIFPSYFSHILIDAPCSGEGMFRREPAAIDALSLYSPDQCHQMQQEILQSALQMVKDQGRIGYSTCTFNRLENEDHSEWLLRNKGVKQIETQRIWPHLQKGEGQYAAVYTVEKENSLQKDKNKVTKFSSELLEAFIKDAINPIFYDFFDYRRMVETEGKVFMLPVTDFDYQTVMPVKPGLFLGELKKKRFEPSADLALALPGHAFYRTVPLESSDPLVYGYLRGETLLYDYPHPGWSVLTADGFPLGWVKKDGSRLKNYFSKSMRRMD